MANSTTTLQSVIDFISTIGDLAPMPSAGGFATLLGKTIANDVMAEMISQRFNWKFNRVVVPPFYTNSYQQDYAANISNIGWLEHAVAIDINNTALPKPIYWLEAVRDLEMTSSMYGRPGKICWLPNNQIMQGVWPGANVTYTNPVGAVSAPANPTTNILDKNGNILVLTTFGITGGVAPFLPAASAAGLTVADGTCVWTCVSGTGQGFRISPLPPQTGVVFQVNVFAQARAVQFANFQQTLEPIPDDYAQHFRTGFMAYATRHAANPVVRQKFGEAQRLWLESLANARGQGDRERDDAGFVPDRGIMATGQAMPIGPAWPYGPNGMGN